jgi:flavin-dependent dehydrogenase
MYDVIVVGGGPGGSVAAKKCTQSGFKTLLLERKRLPRDKVCSGMVMGPWAQDIIQQEFGEIPKEVLVDPYHLSGHMIHVPGVQPHLFTRKTPLAWRKDLDSWMIQNARREGVEIWDDAKVVNVSQERDECTVILVKGKKQQELSAHYVIGADGASSVVRKSLFPRLRVRFSTPIRECYKGSLDLERDYFHWFFPRSLPRPRFCVNHKGDVFLIEGSGIKELRSEINHILKDYGLNPGSQPLWKDGCIEPLLHEELVSGHFSPATGNILLVGDAAGFLFPITFEGIGSALKSGLIAANAIAKGSDQGVAAAEIYLHEVTPVLKVINNLYSLSEGLKQESDKGPAVLAEGLQEAYEETLNVG